MVSRLSKLLGQVETLYLQFATDLWREVVGLSARCAFELSLELHIPESLELPDRPVCRGDKVRVLAERCDKPIRVDRRLWRVSRIRQTYDGPVARFLRQQDSHAEPQTASRALDNAVLIAVFRDPIY